MAATAFNLSDRRGLAVAIVLGVFCSISGAPGVAQSPGTVGFQDFSYGTSVTPRPSGEKAQSKLWWNDGRWWGYLFNATTRKYHIYHLNPATHAWLDTGVAGDDRLSSKADVLWDDAARKLYVVTNAFSTNAQATSSTSKWGRIYRYSYDASTDQYSLDTGFPATASWGTAEVLTLAKDSTGRLWIAWVQNGTVYHNYSTNGDAVFDTPRPLPVAQSAVSVTTDDVAAIVAFGGNRIGVMWSNQKTDQVYFAVHWDADPTTLWQPIETVLPGSGCTGACADDHVSIKADSQGRIYAVVKTSLTGASAPLNVLLVRDTAGAWQGYTFGVNNDNHTRAILVLDEPRDRLFVLATAPEPGGAIYYKTSPMSAPGFAPGRGTAFISSSSDSAINDVTSTRQNLTTASGLLALASSDGTRRYYHNLLTFSGVSISSFSPASGTPGTGVRILGSGFNGATEVRFGQAPASYTVSSDGEINAIVPNGATTGRIVVTTSAGVATSSTDFVITLPPAISSFAPGSGPIGTAVTISGNHFTGASQVTFAGVSAGFVVLSPTSISATVPSGATTGRVGVTTPSGSAQSSFDFVVTAGSGSNRLRDMTFEGGVLVGLPAGADRKVGTVNLEATAPLQGAYSARVPGAGDSYLEVSFAATDDLYVSFYLYLSALPSSDSRIIQISNGGTTFGNIVLQPNGDLRLRAGSSTIGSTTSALSLGTLYRVGIRQRRGSGGSALLEAYLAPGSMPFATPFAALNSGAWTTAADRIRIGATAPGALNAIFDDIRIDAVSMPAPSGGAPEALHDR